MMMGNMPSDGGNLILSEFEKSELAQEIPRFE